MLVHLLEFREEGQEQKEGEAKQREYEAITMGQGERALQTPKLDKMRQKADGEELE